MISAYKHVHGNFTWFFLAKSAADLRAVAPNFRRATALRYDPMATLQALKTPQLWVLGGLDLEAPSAETSLRLKKLISERRPITLAL